MYDFLNYRASHALTAKPVTIEPNSTIRQAEEVFQAHHFNALPVMSGDELVGWLTKLDVLKAFRFSDDSIFPQYEQIMERPVRSAMTPAGEVVHVTSGAPLTRVLEKMVKLQAKSLPVIDDDRLIGVIAREDLLTALRKATRPEPVAATPPNPT